MDSFGIVCLCMFVFAVGFGFGGFVMWLTIHVDVEADIKRGLLKELLADIVERQRVALYMAPEGDLRLGVMRARTLHDFELHLREQLALTPVRR